MMDVLEALETFEEPFNHLDIDTRNGVRVWKKLQSRMYTRQMGVQNETVCIFPTNGL
jgi:hypothetical protein